MNRRGGRSSDGRDVNFGVVDVHDTPYELLVDAVKQTSPKLNPLHAVSARMGMRMCGGIVMRPSR